MSTEGITEIEENIQDLNKPKVYSMIGRFVIFRVPYGTEDPRYLVAELDLHDEFGTRGRMTLPYDANIFGNMGSTYKISIIISKLDFQDYINQLPENRTKFEGEPSLGIA